MKDRARPGGRSIPACEMAFADAPQRSLRGGGAKRRWWALILILLTLSARTQSYSDNGKSLPTGGKNQITDSAETVVFNTRNNTRVVVQRGGLAHLPCVIKWNPSATVSWIRRVDFQLLTVGMSTYSSDERFSVEHTRHMGHWSLRIKAVRDEDRGLYECQLSVHPTQSIFVELQVIEAIAEIIGTSDLHIDERSTLRLECTLRSATEQPAFVFWYLNSKMINYDTENGFAVSSSHASSSSSSSSSSSTLSDATSQLINLSSSASSADEVASATTGVDLSQSKSASYVGSSSSSSAVPATTTTTMTADEAAVAITSSAPIGLSPKRHADKNSQPHMLLQQQSINHLQPQPNRQQQQQHPQQPISISVLTIQEVNFRHAGNYTCAPSNAQPTSIAVHVLKSEKPAAMQHANRSTSTFQTDGRSMFARGNVSRFAVAMLLAAVGRRATLYDTS